MRSLILILALILYPVAAQADSCIKDMTHHQWYFLWFQTGEELVTQGETWIGRDKVAVIEEERKIILDLERNIFIYVNLRDKSYVEMPLPLDPDAVSSEELKQWYAGRRMGGEVTALDTTFDILDFSCAEYDFTYWDYRDGTATNVRTMRVWGTADVDVDIKLFDNFLLNWRLIHNRDLATRDELAKIKGLQLGMEWEKDDFFRNEKIVNRVVEITERTPPFDVYDVPPGFTRKPLLTVGDFKGF